MHVENSFVLRVAGLPADSLRRLRFIAFDLADELARSRTWLHTEGSALADALHAVIGAARSSKPALVGLRRALHRVRSPGARGWNAETAALVPTDTADRIRAWVEVLHRCQRMTAELPDVLAAEWVAKEAVLKDIAAHPHFRRALAYASPALSTELTKWLAGKRPRRQSLIRLAKYVARATAKTSPLSTFTLSGPGTWTTGTPSTLHDVVGMAELDGVPGSTSARRGTGRSR
ncbi:hypothetical protein GCM10029964_077670 [Kibdelosporangium lantanae]